MTSPFLSDHFRHIVVSAVLFTNKFDAPRDLTGTVDFIAMFACSASEYETVRKELAANGSVWERQPTGDYFLLDAPDHNSLRHHTPLPDTEA